MKTTMTKQDAAATLGIELPTTRNLLKTAFRRRSMEEHPDHSKHQKANLRFDAVKQAYEFLKNLSEALEYSDEDAKKLECDDGTPLSECGNGLGPRTNGKPCGSCHAKGYTSYTADKVACADCRPRHMSYFNVCYEYKCRKCSGTGRFKKGDRVIGDCYPCKATGWIQTNDYFNHCRSCHGTRLVANPRGATNYVKCFECKGTGELMVFNPVLPKGLLVGR